LFIITLHTKHLH